MYIYIYQIPKWPFFWFQTAFFLGVQRLTLQKSRGHWGSRYIYRYVFPHSLGQLASRFLIYDQIIQGFDGMSVTPFLPHTNTFRALQQ